MSEALSFPNPAEATQSPPTPPIIPPIGSGAAVADVLNIRYFLHAFGYFINVFDMFIRMPPPSPRKIGTSHCLQEALKDNKPGQGPKLIFSQF